MPKSQDKVAASVHITDAPKMTKKGRKEVADWLRNTADDLESHGNKYADQFRARYWYSGAKDANDSKGRSK